MLKQKDHQTIYFSMSVSLLSAIQAHAPAFSEAALELGSPLIERKTCRPKELILEAGKVCEHLYLAESSIIRCFYHDQEGEEQTLWMKPEQTFLTEYKSFVHGQPSGFSLQVYEATELICISRAALLELYAQSQEWALFGLHLTEHLHITLIDVFVNLLANDATQNYRYIEYAFPSFLQVAPLKDIASMLQVSPVTLSRIRSGTQSKKQVS
ncbi:MAG: Crp/Fnr family transcriptional regulator [Bacteroidota bacterium]